MRGLPDDELKKLNTWGDVKLLNAFEGYSDRQYLVALQDASGVAHKDDTDPDVKGVQDTYVALRKELLKRVPGVSNRDLVDNLESNSNAIAFHSAQGTLGIPDDNKSESEMQTIKANYNTLREQVETELGN